MRRTATEWPATRDAITTTPLSQSQKSARSREGRLLRADTASRGSIGECTSVVLVTVRRHHGTSTRTLVGESHPIVATTNAASAAVSVR
jgi:hypothetical protein